MDALQHLLVLAPEKSARPLLDSLECLQTPPQESVSSARQRFWTHWYLMKKGLPFHVAQYLRRKFLDRHAFASETINLRRERAELLSTFRCDIEYQATLACVRHVTLFLKLTVGPMKIHQVELAYTTGHIQPHNCGWTCYHITRWERTRRATPVLPRWQNLDLEEDVTEWDEEVHPKFKRERTWD